MNQHPGIKTQRRNCPLCASVSAKPLAYGGDGWTTVSCTSCGMVYMPDVPDAGAFADEFEWSQTFAREQQARLERSPLLARASGATRARTKLFGKKHPMSFVRADIASGNIVDIGCGSGSYLTQHAQGFVLFGVDISPVLSAQADAAFAKTGGRAECAPAHVALKAFDSAFFDAAVLRSYLEHEIVPLEVLRELARTMKPGAVAVVKVPNYASLNRRIMGRKWCGFRFPDHVNYFTPQTLTAMAAKAGFSTHMRWRDRLPSADNMWAALRRTA